MAEDKSISEAEKVRILLAEYSSLRAELTARTGHGYQMIGFGFVAVSLLISSFKPDSTLSWAVLLAAFFFIGFGLWIFWKEIMKEAQRMREIELDINFRAKEDLIVWENLWGGASTGIFGKGTPLPRVCLIGRYPPVRTWKGRPIPSHENSSSD